MSNAWTQNTDGSYACEACDTPSFWPAKGQCRCSASDPSVALPTPQHVVGDDEDAVSVQSVAEHKIDHCIDKMIALADEGAKSVMEADWDNEIEADLVLKKIKALDFTSRKYQRALASLSPAAAKARVAELRRLKQEAEGLGASRTAHTEGEDN